jgi:hypothetical protein
VLVYTRHTIQRPTVLNGFGARFACWNLHSRDTPLPAGWIAMVPVSPLAYAPVTGNRHEFLHPMAKPLGLGDLQARIETMLCGVPQGPGAQVSIHPNYAVTPSPGQARKRSPP